MCVFWWAPLVGSRKSECVSGNLLWPNIWMKKERSKEKKIGKVVSQLAFWYFHMSRYCSFLRSRVLLFLLLPFGALSILIFFLPLSLMKCLLPIIFLLLTFGVAERFFLQAWKLWKALCRAVLEPNLCIGLGHLSGGRESEDGKNRPEDARCCRGVSRLGSFYGSW